MAKKSKRTINSWTCGGGAALKLKRKTESPRSEVANQLNLLQNEMTAAAECESVKNCQVNSRIAVRVRRRHNRRLRPSYEVMKREEEKRLGGKSALKRKRRTPSDWLVQLVSWFSSDKFLHVVHCFINYRTSLVVWIVGWHKRAGIPVHPWTE